MTTLALIVAALALTVALAERRHRRTQRRWDQERERLERHQERLVASNGHPHTGNVLPFAPLHNGYDHPEPEELA